MQLRLVLRGRVRSLYTPGRPAVPTGLDRALLDIRRTHLSAAQKIGGAFELVAGGADPRYVADDCSKLGDVMHWTWGNFRAAWFWGAGSRLVVLEVWRKKGMKEKRERVERLNHLLKRFNEELNEYLD